MPESKCFCPRPPTFHNFNFKHLFHQCEAELNSTDIKESLLTSVHNVNSRHTIGRQFLILVRFHMPPIN